VKPEEEDEDGRGRGTRRSDVGGYNGTVRTKNLCVFIVL